MMLEEIRKKYPVNTRGMTVIPCIPIRADTMEEWMIGLQVTVGLSEVGVPTSQGRIEKYDDSHIWVKIGSKTKKFSYDPDDIELSVYQFTDKILFSNETVVRKQPAVEEKEKPKEEKEAPKKKTQPKKKKPAQSTPKKKAAPKSKTISSNPKSLFGL